MTSYEIRRQADRALVAAADRIKRDPTYPRRVRWRARFIALVFRVRLLLRWHRKPAEWLQLPVHGDYCGPGTDLAAPDLSPLDDLDYACQEHDRAYQRALQE